MDVLSNSVEDGLKHQLAAFKLLEHSLFQGFSNDIIYVNLYGMMCAIDQTAVQFFRQQLNSVLKVDLDLITATVHYYFQKEVQKYLTSMGDNVDILLKNYLVFCAWNQYIGMKELSEIATHEEQDRIHYIIEHKLSEEEAKEQIKPGQFGYRYVCAVLKGYTNVADKIYLELARGKDRFNSLKKRDEYKYVSLLDERK